MLKSQWHVKNPNLLNIKELVLSYVILDKWNKPSMAKNGEVLYINFVTGNWDRQS